MFQKYLLRFCFAWISSQLPEQKEGFFYENFINSEKLPPCQKMKDRLSSELWMFMRPTFSPAMRSSVGAMSRKVTQLPKIQRVSTSITGYFVFWRLPWIINSFANLGKSSRGRNLFGSQAFSLKRFRIV